MNDGKKVKVSVSIESKNKGKIRRIIDTTESVFNDNNEVSHMEITKENFLWLIKQATLLDELTVKSHLRRR